MVSIYATLKTKSALIDRIGANAGMGPFRTTLSRSKFRLRLALALAGALIIFCSAVWLMTLQRPFPREQVRLTPAPTLFVPPN
jgi:hypothetical protein